MARSFLTSLTLLGLVFVGTCQALDTTGSTSSHKPDAVKPAAAKPSKPEPKAPAWKDLNPQQKQLLAELATQWDQQPDRLRNGLVKVANKYPKMKPDEQERVRRRITHWANLTPEQRDAARARFQHIKKQPPEKQKEVKKKWEQYKAEQKAATTSAANDAQNATASPGVSHDTK